MVNPLCSECYEFDSVAICIKLFATQYYNMKVKTKMQGSTPVQENSGFRENSNFCFRDFQMVTTFLLFGVGEILAPPENVS